MITYIETKGKITVKLNNKIVGHIKNVSGGYQYFPAGNKNGGNVFKDLGMLKKSLEE